MKLPFVDGWNPTHTHGDFRDGLLLALPYCMVRYGKYQLLLLSNPASEFVGRKPNLCHACQKAPAWLGLGHAAWLTWPIHR